MPAAIRPHDVASYIEQLQEEVAAPSVTQQLAAVRMQKPSSGRYQPAAGRGQRRLFGENHSGNDNFWARELISLGHEVRIIPPGWRCRCRSDSPQKRRLNIPQV